MPRRRRLLHAATLGTAALAAPALVNAQPALVWRMPSSFPRSLDALSGGAMLFARAVAEATDNRFQIRYSSPGEVVPAFAVLDAVQAGTVECCHTTSFYFTGKDPSFAFFTNLPFGMNTWHLNAWMYAGGGIELMAEFLADYNAVPLTAGNTSAQMGGFFRRELRGLDDLRGMKFRISGLAGQVMQRLGVVPSQIPGGDIYPALERGTIDAAEWTGPYDDEKLGFHRVAPWYYYPGFMEGGALVHVLVNRDQWAALPKSYQAVLRMAAAEANHFTLSKYDAENPAALRRMVAQGAKLTPFPREIMDAAYREAFALFDEIGRNNAKFHAIWEAWSRFRADQFAWSRVCEFGFDSYFYARQGRAGGGG